MAAILNSLIVDVVFNSIYGQFKKENKLFWWILFNQVYYWATLPFWLLPFLSLFVPIQEAIEIWFIPLMSVMLPIIILEAIAGSYVGYKIYKRVENAATGSPSSIT